MRKEGEAMRAKEGKELVKFTYELESEDKTIDFLVLGELFLD